MFPNCCCSHFSKIFYAENKVKFIYLCQVLCDFKDAFFIAWASKDCLFCSNPSTLTLSSSKARRLLAYLHAYLHACSLVPGPSLHKMLLQQRMNPLDCT